MCPFAKDRYIYTDHNSLVFIKIRAICSLQTLFFLGGGGSMSYCNRLKARCMHKNHTVTLIV